MAELRVLIGSSEECVSLNPEDIHHGGTEDQREVVEILIIRRGRCSKFPQRSYFEEVEEEHDRRKTDLMCLFSSRE